MQACKIVLGLCELRLLQSGVSSLQARNTQTSQPLSLVLPTCDYYKLVPPSSNSAAYLQQWHQIERECYGKHYLIPISS